MGLITKQELSEALLAELQLSSGGTTTSGFVGVSVLDFGAKGDGITNDYRAIQDAINTGLPVFVPYTVPGYKINDTLEVDSKTILYGENQNTQIVQVSNNRPILRITGSHFHVYQLHLTYKNQQTATMSAGTGIELGNAYTNEGAHEGKINHLTISNAFIGIGVPTWQGDAFSFLNTFEHIRVLNSWDFAFYITSRIVGLTTNTFINCYALCSEDDLRPNSKGFLIGNHDDFVMINCACDHAPREALWLEGNRGGTILDFHAEKCRVSDSYFSIVRIKTSKVNFTNLSIPYTIIKANVTEAYLFWVYENSEVVVNNFAERDTTVLGTGFFASIVSDATSYIKIDSVKNTLPVSFSGKKSVEMRQLQSNVIPTAGKWKVGEIVYNTAPVSGAGIGWVCVTAGDFSTTTKPVFKVFGMILA